MFVHSRRDPREVVSALDLGTGKILWQESYAGEYQKNRYAVRMGKGPNSTPLVAGNRLFTLGATAFLMFGDDRDHSLEKWNADKRLFDVAAKATRANRVERYQSIKEFCREWESAK